MAKSHIQAKVLADGKTQIKIIIISVFKLICEKR